MRIVAALGGNALLERGEPPEAGLQEAHVATAAELRKRDFPAGSMRPKIEAVCWFTEATGKPAAIGSLADAQVLLAQQAGTIIAVD